ncbi:MAG: hypothetical protein J6Y92_09855 [Lentisphaeria bacterium]|nr:hypothetical protein [Lentisphaeria bacterium]
MTEIRYELEFFSAWHCGSGMSGGNDADYVPVLDHDGLPFVPGKTVKGLFHEAAETLFDADFVGRVFGVSDSRDVSGPQNASAGAAIWSNAALPEKTRRTILKQKQNDLLQINRYFIRIDEKGQTEEKSLRRGEFIVPMTLAGTIRGLEEADADKLVECMGFIKRLGLQRSRGFGVCQFRLVEKTAEARPEVQNIPEKQEYFFRCRFLTQIVLNNTGATEGVIDTLEYIPGANFLGIAARNYADYGDKAFELFHSGKVRFGAAYPLDAGGHLSLPCPANWFIPKGKSLFDKDCEVFCTPEKREESRRNDIQPKQVRAGFFVPDKAPHVMKSGGKSYSLKSAYDSEKRRAEDGMLYGYTALPAGSEWGFSVRADKDVSAETLRQVVASLIGKKQIGRSRNAQYGSVEITLLDKSPLPAVETVAPVNGKYYFYAASPLAFLDEYGEPTLLPGMSDLGFPPDAEAGLDMESTMVRYHKYCPWNGARKSRDAERLVILPGSVLVVNSNMPPAPEVISRGVGVFLSEGFGQLMCNPGFLFCGKLGSEAEIASSGQAESRNGDDCLLLAYLDRRNREFELVKGVYDSVREFSRMNERALKRITPSQWGAVRAIAIAQQNYSDMMDALFRKDEAHDNDLSYEIIIKNGRVTRPHHQGFLLHGKMSRKWDRRTGLAEKLEESVKAVRDSLGERAACMFIEVLASQMPKTIKTAVKEN